MLLSGTGALLIWQQLPVGAFSTTSGRGAPISAQCGAGAQSAGKPPIAAHSDIGTGPTNASKATTSMALPCLIVLGILACNLPKLEAPHKPFSIKALAVAAALTISLLIGSSPI
jgi:hypothetical protein